LPAITALAVSQPPSRTAAAAGVDAASRVRLVRPGSGQLGEQGAHRRTLVGKDPDVAVPTG